jgi:hypothetical protein
MRVKPGTTARVREVAKLTGRSVGTIWRWAAQGCDLNSPASINEYLEGNRLRQHANLIKAKDVRRNRSAFQSPLTEPPDSIPDLDQIELGPVGKRGAAAALQRLEEVEERAHARLIRAIEAGNPFRIKAAQEFYLRSSETLRRLDLAVETERRKADEQVPKMLVEGISRQISEWMRLGFAQFLASESERLMGIDDLGEFKFLAIERFRGILHRTVKTSIANNSPIPPWAADRVREAWNISSDY